MEGPEFWNDTILGIIDDWPSTLQAFNAFTTTLPHPAAIYWGDELVILQNEAWKRVCKSKDQQGKAQREHLDAEALEAINNALKGDVQRNVPAATFINTQEDVREHLDLLLSPVMDKNSTKVPGIIVQLLPSQHRATSKPNVMKEIAQEAGLTEENKDDTRSDEAERPLNEHRLFKRIAEMLPAGIAILDHSAESVFVNQKFYDLTSTQNQPNSFKSWPGSIHPDDHERVIKGYQDAFASHEELRCEFRILGDGEPWRLLLITSLGDDEIRQESLKVFGGFVCVVVDITPNKAQEFAQKKATELAQARKEQQERFIDMISHEIRNPLSAVLHCAEDIMEAYEADSAPSSDVQEVPNSMALVEEAVETIKLCVLHQKNIVDDILSFSKLDSSMMSLVPKSVQPKVQLAHPLKMFQPELRKQEIGFEYAMDVSYDDECHVDWVEADLMRISQVVVNLMTNAIKFTSKTKGDKKISVGVGASLKRPTSYPPNVVFFDTDDIGYRLDGTNTSEWGNGEALYILVAIKDTGIGISNENQTKLFQRFRQATPKTEDEYGGTGLGLNISRKICQLHGGEIGVASKEDEGSTFGFFFKVRRTEIRGDGTPTAEDQLEHGEIEDMLCLDPNIGKGAPIERVDDEDAQKDLLHPPKEHIKYASGEKNADAKFKNTSDAVSEVAMARSSGGDYAASDRPSTSSSPERSQLTKLQEKTDVEQASKRDGPEESTENGQSDKLRILLVEDNAVNQRVLKRRLEKNGLAVVTANNGREAVDAINQLAVKLSSQEQKADNDRYDLILMDQEMPVMDGNAATKAIRKMESDGNIPHIPILGVTANVRDEQKAEMRSAGMDDVISKPYTIEEIIQMIKGLVKQDEGF